MLGTFTVGTLGQIEVDFVYDGGWFEGELAAFSLDGMEAYQPGSLDYVQEAANRALSNSTKGHIIISDRLEGAKFGGEYNQGEYQGIKNWQMNPGDKVGLMLVQHTTVETIYQNPSRIYEWGKLPIFSIPEANINGDNLTQVVAVDNKGTIAFEDIAINQLDSDQNYQDFIVQIKGMKGNLATIDQIIAPEQDWRDSITGQQILDYVDRDHYSAGVFEVGEAGEITFDFLYDGGWFQGELAIFSLQGMESYQPGSNEFILEATNRALSNSPQGYILANDREEGARFNHKVWWESNFNQGEYQGVKTFTMNPGDEFAVMLVQNSTVETIAQDINLINRWGKLPIFSIPEANLGINQGADFDSSLVSETLLNTALGQFVGVDGNGVYALEDIRLDQSSSDKDYNDFVFQLKGATSNTQILEKVVNPQRDWRYTEGGQELLSYANRAVFEQGVFVVGDSGQITVDFLFDGGDFDNAELGIFSLNGLEQYETGSEAFIQEVINRVQSNTEEGYLIVQDNSEGARFNGEFLWEGSHNDGEYQGKQTLHLTPGDSVGLVLVPDGTFEDALIAPNWHYRKKPLFSMDTANLNDTIQVGEVSSTDDGVIVAFEDVHLVAGLEQNYADLYYMDRDRDYNDLVLGMLVYEYEEKHEPMPELTDGELLKALMEEYSLQIQDFLNIFDTEATVLEILQGRRKITAQESKKLINKYY